MRETLQLYSRYIGVSLRAQMQYRFSFALQLLAQLGLTGIEFLALAALFKRFGGLRGWTLPEICVLYGMVHVAFALAEAIARGFDTFPSLVKSGGFDRILLRPRGTAFQILASELQLMRLGRFLQGLAILAYGMSALESAQSAAALLIIPLAIAGGACLFGGLFVLTATLAFWTIEGLEIMNVFLYGGVEASQYPIEIFRPWLRRALTFGLPLACINYVPAQAFLPRFTGCAALAPWLAPLVGVAFLLLALLFWRTGVRRYTSTGS